nr:helix-turn-helix domain-containing protein [Acinetobacter baumannii]
MSLRQTRYGSILFHLIDSPKRQSELLRLIPNISQKVLIQQLREMEEHGIVSRFVHPVVPPKVEYSVTTLGFSLSPICKQLCDWGEKHLKEEETNNQKNQLKQK